MQSVASYVLPMLQLITPFNLILLSDCQVKIRFRILNWGHDLLLIVHEALSVNWLCYGHPWSLCFYLLINYCKTYKYSSHSVFEPWISYFDKIFSLIYDWTIPAFRSSRSNAHPGSCSRTCCPEPERWRKWSWSSQRSCSPNRTPPQSRSADSMLKRFQT